MTLQTWIHENKEHFFDRDLRYLLKKRLGFSAMVSRDCTIEGETLRYLNAATRAYKNGFPMAYIIGKEEFLGLEFKVNQNVLIPRKETELIVEKALEIITTAKLSRILDLGCGSGNIAVSIKHALPKVHMSASDISKQALGVARHNAVLHKTAIDFFCGNLFDCCKETCFDMIVTNPPYVAKEEIKNELTREPRSALEADNCGFSTIEKIVTSAFRYLIPRGYLIIEVGYNHKDMVENFVQHTGEYSTIEWIKDYDGHFRGAVLQLKPDSNND